MTPDKQTQEIIDSCNNYYESQKEIRDRLTRLFKCQPDDLLVKEQSNNINEVAQLKQALDVLWDEPCIVQDIKQRLSYLMWGRKHPARRDSEIPNNF
jgi:hypothetical protein